MPVFQRITNKLLGNDSDREVKNPELIKYASGIMGQNMCYNLMMLFLFFCTDIMELDPFIIGSILAASRVWDAVNDPIVGSIVDKHTFKNGEKLRPYLKIFAIPIGLVTMFLFVDWGLPNTYTYIYIVVLYFIFDFFYSFQDVAQWGMTAMISTRSSERSRAAQIGRIAGTIGSWPAGLVTVFLGVAGKIGISGKTVFIIAGAVLGLGGMILSMNTYAAKERAPSKPVEGGAFGGFSLLFKNKIVMLVTLANILSSITLSLDQIYFFKYMVNINIGNTQINGLTLNFIFGILVGLPGTLCMVISVWFARKVGGMKNVILIAVISNIICRFGAFLVGYEGYRIIFVGIFLAITGIPNGMMGIATTTLWGDSLDYMELTTGQRNEGLVFSMQNFVAKITTAIRTFFVGVTLKLLMFDSTKYDLGLPQSDVFIKYSWPVFILAPALGALFYLIPVLFIKYNDKQRAIVEERLRIARGLKDGSIVNVRSGMTNNLEGRKFSKKMRTFIEKTFFLEPKKEPEQEIIV